MSPYLAVVTREGDTWLAEAPQVPGAHTFARSLPALDREIREAIALALDLPENAEAGLDLAYEYHIGDPSLEDNAAALRAERVRLAEAERELTERTRQLARELVVDRKLSVRDAATLLGVSAQRISQIVPQAKAS